MTSGAMSVPDGAWIVATREDLRTLHPAMGEFVARRKTTVGPQVSGRVVEVLVDVGGQVEEDQPLVKIDPTFRRIALAQREADVEAARVGLEDAERNFERMRNLWEKPGSEEPSIPKKAYDEAKTRRDDTRARLKQAEEALRYAATELAECTVLAPFDGVITRRLVDEGEPVHAVPVTHLLEVAEVDPIELEFSLPQRMLARIGPGTEVFFRADGSRGGDGAPRDGSGAEDGAERGTISTVFPTVDEATRTFRCRVLVENAPPRYLPGLLVQVHVVDARADGVVAVPREAIARSGEGWEVLVQDDGEGGAGLPRPVKIGLEAGGLVEVKEGLAPGERVRVPGGALR